MKKEAIGEREIAHIFDTSSKFALFGGLSTEQMQMILAENEAPSPSAARAGSPAAPSHILTPACRFGQ